jgi:hypothetical protein
MEDGSDLAIAAVRLLTKGFQLSSVMLGPVPSIYKRLILLDLSRSSAQGRG